MNVEVEKRYNELYATNSLLMTGSPSVVVQRLSAVLPLPARILDVGSGRGRNALWLARNGYEVVGVDLSRIGLSEMILLAQREDLPIEGIYGDIREFNGDTKFNGVVVDMVLHHFVREERERVIHKLQAMTEGDGYHAVKVPLDVEGSPVDGLFTIEEVLGFYDGWRVKGSTSGARFFSGEKGKVLSFIARRANVA